jgi:hypothetical protein
MKKTLDSGATLEVTLSPFEVGHRLLKAVVREIEMVNVEFGVRGKSFKDIFEDIGDEAVNTIKNMAARLVSSDAVEEILWLCMERATYNGIKINRDTFEDERARGDYLIVAKEVLWFNLAPFLKNLASMFPALVGKTTTSQKSK